MTNVSNRTATAAAAPEICAAGGRGGGRGRAAAVGWTVQASITVNKRRRRRQQDSNGQRGKESCILCGPFLKSRKTTGSCPISCLLTLLCLGIDSQFD